MRELRSDEAGQRPDRRQDRHGLELDLALGGVVLEGRIDLLESERVEPDLVVLVVGVPGPIAHRRDRGRIRAILASADDLGLLHSDVGLGGRAVERGHVIIAGEARDSGAGIAAVEQVGAADRAALAVQRRVWLPAVHRRRGIGRKQIRIARDEIVVGAAAEHVGMERRIAAARVEQQGALPSVVHRGAGCAQLGGDAARRRECGNAVVDGFDHAADRLRPVTQGDRPTISFSFLDRQRIERHAVILAERGDVG